MEVTNYGTFDLKNCIFISYIKSCDKNTDTTSNQSSIDLLTLVTEKMRNTHFGPWSIN